MAAPFVEALRPKPFRGDVIAAGVVVLATLVWLLEVRLDEEWSNAVHLAYEAVAAAFVGTVAFLAPMERETPRAYQSVLYVATVALVLPALIRLGDVLGGAGGSGQLTWVFAGTTAVALFFAVERNSAISTLLGAVLAGLTVLLAVEWLFDPDGFGTFRWVLMALTVILTLVALAQRDRRRAHAVGLVDAAGVAVLAIGVSLVAETTILGAFFTPDVGASADAAAEQGEGVAWGWQVLSLGAGFGLIAYSSVDRERGPAYLGVLSLIVFLVLAGDGGFAGWPLVLVAIAALLLVVGLRPTTPAPPPPDADVPPAPTEPLRPADA